MSVILNEIGTTFIPVKSIEEARDWYSDLLGVPISNEILFGHLYILPMKGTGIVLDSRIYEEENVFKTPAFHFNTQDIQNAYDTMKAKGIELTTEIKNDHWFNFKDPFGNHLMVCKC